MRAIVYGVLFSVLAGCASKGFNRGALREQIGVTKPVVSDPDVKAELKKKSNLPRPFKMAVYFKRPPEKGNAKPKWRWTEEDKNLILDAAKDLQGEKLVSEVFPLLGSLVGSEDLKSLRVAAAKQGADALLIVDGTGDIDRYINGMGWSYILLVTTLFVPGSQSDTLFMANATLWDVRNEYLYLGAESEGKFSDRYIAAFGDKDEALYDKAKSDSLKNLRAQLTDMVKGIKK